MIPGKINGATRTLGAPPNWDESKAGHCGALPIRTLGTPENGNGFCESAWTPTPEELAILNAGGSVILRVAGWQVPVMLYAEPAA